MADNDKYIATWSDDLTSYSSSSTYSRASIGHGVIAGGLHECIVSIWVCNSSNKTYQITVEMAGGALGSNSDIIGDDFVLPPMSTVVFNGAAEKIIHSGNINFILTNNSQPVPAAGEVVAHVTVEYTEALS
mgnify:CR=1 FL=1